ncbi:MAG: hypothetical protein AB2802_13075 [Candidatus Thiodiazotropha endolucinida]
MKLNILLLISSFSLSPFLVVHAGGLGELVQTPDNNRPGYMLLSIIDGCRSGPTKSNGGREDCHKQISIEPPAGYMLLGNTFDITTIANKGTGHGCRENPKALSYDSDGRPYISGVSVYANARSDHGANVFVLAGVTGGVSAVVGHLYNDLGTAGAVSCKISITAKKIN